MGQTSLVVPMNLTALCVSSLDEQSDHFGSVAVDFRKLNTGEPYQAGLPEPFSGESVPAGIHLHWALPDSLAHGEVGNGNRDVVFRPAPDRFLVVRIAVPTTPAQGTPPLDAWIVESDFLSVSPDNRPTDMRTARSRAVPLTPALDPYNADSLHGYQGRVVDFAAWNESPSNRKVSSHTAVGYGNETYAAAYPHCPNVFGFFDPLGSSCPDGLYHLGQTLKTPRFFLSYLVIGWHSHTVDTTAACDPITRETARILAEGKALTPAALAAALETNYRWSYAHEEQPARTLYVGQLTSLEWIPDKTYVKRTTGHLDVAIGGTTVEAFSALLAGKSKQPAIETVLNELQYDLLDAYGLDGEANLQRALHQRGFTPVAAGHADTTESGRIWILKRKSDDLATDAKSLQSALPIPISSALNTLNDAQSRYDEIAAEIATRRGQVFADWTQYVARKDAKQDVNDLLNYLKAEIDALAPAQGNPDSGKMEQKMEACRVARDAAKRVLTDLLANQPYTLESDVAPRFYQPGDPVILLSGPDVNPSYRYGGDGRFDKGGNLICRLSSDITQKVTIGSETIDARNQQLPKLPANTGIAPQDAAEFAALVAEAVFLDHQLAPLLALQIQGATSDLAAQIQKAQYDYIGHGVTGSLIPLNSAHDNTSVDTAINATGPTIRFAGLPPSPVGFTWYEQPWIPFILQWEAKFDPLVPVDKNTPYSAKLALDDFKLDSDTGEMIYNGKLPTSKQEGMLYTGMVSLTGRTEINLTKQIETYLHNHPINEKDSPETQRMKHGLQQLLTLRLSMLAQAMGGLHRQLRMRAQSLQLPVFDPDADPVYDAPFIRNVSHAVSGANDSAALPTADYNPLRAGMLHLTRLRLLDAFGQVRDIPVDQVTLSHALRKPDDATEKRALLPLRFTQPARLSFRYRSANNSAIEMNSDPASSPVFGWVLLNRLDNALAIYSAEGTAIGSFNLNGLSWQGAPGPHGQFERTLQDSFAKAHPLLRDFALNLGGGAPGDPQSPDYPARLKAFDLFLAALLDTIDHGAMGIVPDSYAQDPGLSLLMGRPLALVCADLRLDLHGGLPALNQSATALDRAVSDFKANGVYDYAARDAAHFDQVRFPVRIGDSVQVNDGVIGYFVESAQNSRTETFGTFYSSFKQGDSDRIKLPAPGDLTLATADTKPATVLMLIDPRAPVHLSTGILPSKNISLPPSHFADALKRIAVTFLTAPVLGAPDSPALPVPAEVGHAWSWLTLHADAKQDRAWQTQPIVVSPNLRGAFSTSTSLSEGWLRLYPADTSSQPPSEGDNSDRSR